MISAWSRELWWGAAVAFPSLLMAGINTATWYAWREGWKRSILFSSAPLVVTVPFFLGIWIYLLRLLKKDPPASAAQSLNLWIGVASLALVCVLVVLVWRVARPGDRVPPPPRRPGHSFVLLVVMLMAAAMCWRLSAPLATENRTPWPSRIFNESGQDAVSIVTSVLAERGLSAVESASIKDHAFRSREYCVQYQESDLHFVEWLETLPGFPC